MKTWHLTLLPRVVELNPTRPPFEPDDDSDGLWGWQSGCSNPAALSVSIEARKIALRHFRIACPLAFLTRDAAEQIDSRDPSGPSATGTPSLRRRTLHISPESDSVALIGRWMSSGSSKLPTLLDSFRDADPQGAGISSLALGTTPSVLNRGLI